MSNGKPLAPKDNRAGTLTVLMNLQLGGLFAKALVPIAVLGGLALFRRYLPSKMDDATDHETSMEVLDVRFQRTKWMATACMILIGIVFAWSTHAALLWLNRHLAAVDGPAEITILSQAATWWFFPGFGALALSWEITLQLWSVLGSRKKADQYSDWSNTHAGMDSRKVLRWMALLIALPIGVLTLLDVSEHTVLRQDDIRDCGYAFKPCKIYRYADARRLTRIDGFRDREGKLHPRAGIVIEFRDGRRWSSADTGDFKKTVDPALEAFLQRKTGLQLGNAETESDIPQLGG